MLQPVLSTPVAHWIAEEIQGELNKTCFAFDAVSPSRMGKWSNSHTEGTGPSCIEVLSTRALETRTPSSKAMSQAAYVNSVYLHVSDLKRAIIYKSCRSRDIIPVRPFMSREQTFTTLDHQTPKTLSLHKHRSQQEVVTVFLFPGCLDHCETADASTRVYRVLRGRLSSLKSGP